VSPTPAEIASRARRGVGWFPGLERGVVRVAGGDRVRWLNGMITADVASLGPGALAYALLLSPKGRIVADLYVLERGEEAWLDCDADGVAPLLARLERYIIADDVTLHEAGAELWRAALEGPGTHALLASLGVEAPAPGICLDAEIAGARVVLAGFGESGERAVQLFVPSTGRHAVEAAVVDAGGDALVLGDAASLEVLRIEAGVPRMGRELDEDTLPSEAGLVARAVSLTKGCFTGQEIVARLESRGQVNHRLVGLAFESGRPPEPGCSLASSDGRVVGEVTSACASRLGAIGLGYVRRPNDTPGTRLRAADDVARVAALPFVSPGAA
jgi:folate-binding protein YgfZ